MMKIEHVAVWAKDPEKMKEFYVRFFDGKASDIYHNPNTGFSSYFITFQTGTRLEIMNKPNLTYNEGNASLTARYAHLAFAVGSKEKVEALTEKMRNNACLVISEPRTTGDGYFESCVADPEGNPVEITV